jgi:hypothetical protein
MHEDGKAGSEWSRRDRSVRTTVIGLVLAAAGLQGCGSSASERGSGGSGGTGASGGSGGSGGCSTVLYVPCNGACLRPGETMNGCTALTDDLAYGLAVDENRLYFSAARNIESLDFGSLTQEPLVTDLELPSDVVLGRSTLYFLTEWTEPAISDDLHTGTLRSVATTGGTVQILAQGLETPQRLALIDEALFLGSGIVSQFNIDRIPTAGGPLERIFYQEVTAFAIDGNEAYFTVPPYIDDNIPKLHRATIGDALSDTPVADIGATVDWLFVDATHVYFEGETSPSENPPEYVYGRIAKSDGALETLATRALPFRVKAVDGDDIYLLEKTSDSAQLLRMPLSGGDTETITTLSDTYSAPVVVDAGYVYIGSSDGILRIAK